MTKFAFDANVVIGLHTVHHLEFVMSRLSELSDTVCMDKNNVRELLMESGIKQKRVLEQSKIFKEISPDEEDFKKFKTELADRKIFLQGVDKYVLYIAQKQKVDYVVTFDQTVLRKTDTYRKKYGIKYMKSMTTVGLIHYLYMNDKIKFDEYLGVVLNYFKYVEMDNLFDAITNPSREWDLKAVRERFQRYKDPILDGLREKIDGAQTKVDMYG
jgi:predicted nucleic acid-binding protein